jgi:hypothetical protein
MFIWFLQIDKEATIRILSINQLFSFGDFILLLATLFYFGVGVGDGVIVVVITVSDIFSIEFSIFMIYIDWNLTNNYL